MPPAWTHPSATVDAGAILGDDTKVWHYAHVCSGARIGARCVLGQGCYVASSVAIGDGCRIQNHVSLYDGVTLADEVFLGPSCVFTNVTHPRAHVSRKADYAPTRVGHRASIGANATIVCGVTIGPYALVGAGAVVTRDVAPHAIVVGTPARAIGWACRCGETLPPALDGTLATTRVCTRCGDRYRLVDGALALALASAVSRDV